VGVTDIERRQGGQDNPLGCFIACDEDERWCRLQEGKGKGALAVAGGTSQAERQRAARVGASG
jgi:hypothetical protein